MASDITSELAATGFFASFASRGIAMFRRRGAIKASIRLGAVLALNPRAKRYQPDAAMMTRITSAIRYSRGIRRIYSLCLFSSKRVHGVEPRCSGCRNQTRENPHRDHEGRRGY